MPDARFGYPALVNKLDQVYGTDANANKQSITLRESKGVSKFLEDKKNWQKKSSEAKTSFK